MLLSNKLPKERERKKRQKRRNVKIEEHACTKDILSLVVERREINSSTEQKRVVHLIHHRMINTSPFQRFNCLFD